MNVSETIMGGDPERYEQRYGIQIGNSVMQMVRRSVSIIPAEGTIASLDNGPRLGVIPRICVGVFKGGKWTGARFEPTHWVNLDGEAHAARN